ncbi:unnamed protein product [Bursaphelenchus xylophilus]|uniref:(pine wood nematode) hypothetical protein n=1 Tax=Bursaphelenchus xylophilus TaxID=6326 RepID=A0A1I7S1K6_BURXY|nr:unnamed protein product [Bursaphelenchus xylophilus]CAG9081339.1 unnamed protein product [Bursaphelenchus xylophilus]
MEIEETPSISKTSCFICSTIPASTHFGVASCRSCAAFFRRSIVLKRDYECKRKGKCKIFQADRSSCPACRLKKCIANGMQIKKIRHHCDKNGPCQRTIAPRAESELTKCPPTLSKMVEGYKEFIEDSRNLYFALNPENAFSRKVVYKAATAQEHAFIDRAGITYYLKMLNNSFHPFSELSIKEQKSVLEIFHFRFTFLNEFYLNTVFFPGNTDKHFLHFGAYLDFKNPEYLFSYHKNIDEASRTFFPIVAKVIKVTKKFQALKVDQTEVVALMGVALWREIVSQFPGRGYDEVLARIQAELSEYTRNTNGSDPFRVGRLMCLLRGLEELSLILSECLTIGLIMNDVRPDTNTDLFKT